MAAPDLTKALRVPGTFWVDPSDVSGSTGTQLGAAKEVVVRRTLRTFDVTAEEWGGEVVESHYLGEQWWIGASFRGLDSDVVTEVFRNTTAASASEELVQIDWPNTSGVVEGAPFSDTTFKLLFVPHDTDNHHAVYFRTAIAHTVDDLELAHSRNTEQILAVVFRALRDGTTESASVQMRALEDITL